MSRKGSGGNFIRFIDEKLMGEVCRTIGQPDSVKEAISISAKFCVKAFTINECIAHDREVSTFCASTIFLSSKREFLDKASGQKRSFSIERDLQNELTDAVKRGEHPLPILGYVSLPEKARGLAMTPHASKDTTVESDHSSDLRLEQEILMSRLTKSETQVVTGSDGRLGVDNVAKKFKLSRQEAASVVRRIKAKLEVINL